MSIMAGGKLQGIARFAHEKSPAFFFSIKSKSLEKMK